MTHPRIRIPDTIYRVDWCRQYVDFPRAHDLVVDDPNKTYIADPLVLPHSHSRIQWSEPWIELAMDAANNFANPPKVIPVSLRRHDQ